MNALDLGRAVERLPKQLRTVIERVSVGESLGQVLGVTEPELDSLYALGYGALAAGRLGEARQVLGALVSLDPQRSRAWAALAVVFERLGEPGEAAALFAIAAAIDGSAPFWLRSAECSVAAGNREGARRAAGHATRARGCTELVRQRARLVIEEVTHD